MAHIGNYENFEELVCPNSLGLINDSVFPHAQELGGYVLVYGSAAYGGLPTSDIDMIVALPEPEVVAEAAVIDAVRTTHHALGRREDHEVPYENKVLYGFHDIDEAVHLRAFTSPEGDIAVTPIKKSPEFLRSREVKLRLAFNALTTPHVVIADEKDLSTYNEHRLTAEASLRNLAVTLGGHDQTGVGTMNREVLVDPLLCSPTGETGDDYLGYKSERQIVADHLLRIMSEASHG